MSDNFENFIMQCCKAPEWELRKFLKKILGRAGFSFVEDDYMSERVRENSKYASVHNLLAVRGESPRVCLVAHTDVCRDHDNKARKATLSYIKVNKEENESVLEVNPIISTTDIEIDGVMKEMRIITDNGNKVQVGGDDRLGVAINTWIAINTGYDMGLLFTTDEEIGLKSARYVKMPELKQFDLMVQVDRGNNTDELVTKIGSTELCSKNTAIKLLEIAYDLNLPRKPVVGYSTDVVAMKDNNVIKEAVNMTCGYHNSTSDNPNEYILIDEAKDTLKYVAGIVRHYYLTAPLNQPITIE